jgi:hypothetical protein
MNRVDKSIHRSLVIIWLDIMLIGFEIDIPNKFAKTTLTILANVQYL